VKKKEAKKKIINISDGIEHICAVKVTYSRFGKKALGIKERKRKRFSCFYLNEKLVEAV
jgi:hypothetical protein